MKEYTVYCDLHIGGTYEIFPKFVFGKNTAFLGDNFDLKNTLKIELPVIERLRKEVMNKCKKNKCIYVAGNHSLEKLKNKFYQIRENILFLHGDIIQKGFKKAELWRERYSEGKSHIYWDLLKLYRKIFSGHLIILKRKYIKRAYELAMKNKCHTIVMGHFHPRKIIDLKKKEVRIIFMPRGVSKIKI